MSYKISSSLGGGEFFGELASIYECLDSYFCEVILKGQNRIHLRDIDRINDFQKFVNKNLSLTLENHVNAEFIANKKRIIKMEHLESTLVLNLSNKVDKRVYDWFSLRSFLDKVIRENSTVIIDRNPDIN